MNIKSIALDGFRNHGGAGFAFGSGVNIVCGANGVGKTNLLEAIFLLSGVRSWRTASRKELIGWGGDFARINAEINARDRDFQVSITLPRQGRAKATVNGASTGRGAPLSDVFRAVLFSPEDLLLIKGPPSVRRDFIDSALSQLRPRYAQLIARHAKLVMGKNKLLKQQDGLGLEILPELNAQLAKTGAAIIGYRHAFCTQLNLHAAAVHSAISGGAEGLEIKYKTVSTVLDPAADAEMLESWLLEHLEALRAAEIASGNCLSGVHRDDLEICINSREARAFASQGQSRSAALAMRFAQREIFFRDMGEYPVLLLDDVLSELDEHRRDFVCRHTLGGQSIITCCQREPGFEDALVTEL